LDAQDASFGCSGCFFGNSTRAALHDKTNLAISLVDLHEPSDMRMIHAQENFNLIGEGLLDACFRTSQL